MFDRKKQINFMPSTKYLVTVYLFTSAVLALLLIIIKLAYEIRPGVLIVQQISEQILFFFHLIGPLVLFLVMFGLFLLYCLYIVIFCFFLQFINSSFMCVAYYCCVLIEFIFKLDVLRFIINCYLFRVYCGFIIFRPTIFNVSRL